MKRILFMLMLFALSCTFVQAAQVQNLSAPEARQMLQQNKNTYLLDVRTPEEYLQVRIDGAHLIPIDKLMARIDEIPKDRPLLIYCAVGSRSDLVSKYLVKQGFGQVYNLNGGIWAWQLRNYPTLQGAP
ncbi:MAG: rhodanese-like domain-containing protein [Deltaproteobacteria bacterium]|nr:rhodanese-like domain-containing protein [Deltaproteobacteria bacterium]